MKDKLNKLLEKILPWINRVRKYKMFIFFIVLLLLYGFLVFRINTLSNKEPSDDSVTAKLQTVSRPHIDESVIEKIQLLRDNSVKVKTLFNQARQNPFQE